MTLKEFSILKSKILILGITFKENCPDTRNSKVIELYNEFKLLNINVDVYDPHADKKSLKLNHKISLIEKLNFKPYNVVIIAVSHNEFMRIDFKKVKENDTIIYDLKSLINKNISDARL